jgi:ferrous-iron efflux pump FieF
MSIANPYLAQGSATDKHSLNLKRWAAAASLGVGVILIAVKFVAFIMTDSVSMLSSLMDSSFDAVASLVTMISIAHAATPADEEHRFGHGKMEALSALGQAVFIFGSAIFLLFESIRRFFTPMRLHDADVGVCVMVLSIVLTGTLIAFQVYVIRKTRSVAIAADHLHYKGDLLMNLGVFMALTLSYYSRWPYYDPLFAGIIALALLYGSHSITRESFDILMDKEIPAADREKIMALVRAHKGVAAIHDLRTRNTGARIFIEFHMEVDGELTLNRAHVITEEVEKILFDAFPNAEVLIHQEPAGIDDHRLDNIIPLKTS